MFVKLALKKISVLGEWWFYKHVSWEAFLGSELNDSNYKKSLKAFITQLEFKV